MEPFHLTRNLYDQAFRFNERKLTDAAVSEGHSFHHRQTLDRRFFDGQTYFRAKLSTKTTTRTDQNMTIMSEPLKQPVPSSVKFITERGSSFRIFHADGAWGMATADDNIQLNFFVERPPFPKVVIQSIDEEGTPTDQMKVIDEIEEGDDEVVIVRDFQSAIVMSLKSARSIHRILGNFIKSNE